MAINNLDFNETGVVLNLTLGFDILDVMFNFSYILLLLGINFSIAKSMRTRVASRDVRFSRDPILSLDNSGDLDELITSNTALKQNLLIT